MTWFPWRRRQPKGGGGNASRDQRVIQLTAKADLIVDELDDVVQQMSELLRRKYS